MVVLPGGNVIFDDRHRFTDGYRRMSPDEVWLARS
jgi:hypothetical protein